MTVYLTREPIHPQVLAGESPDFHSGAEVVFAGKIRNHSEGRQVLYLEYEAYEGMAEKMIRNLAADAKALWPVDRILVRHRLGKILPGEIAVWIQVEAAHRDEAYRASRFLIEAVKHKVPIWKKEYFADGASEWSRCGQEEIPC